MKTNIITIRPDRLNFRMETLVVGRASSAVAPIRHHGHGRERQPSLAGHGRLARPGLPRQRLRRSAATTKSS